MSGFIKKIKMKITAPSKKILSPGLQLVTIKACHAVRGDSNALASWIDPATGNPTGSMRVLFMGKNNFGIEHDFWLGKAHLPRIEMLGKAIGVSFPAHKDAVIGKKVWVLIAKVLVFNNGVPQMNDDGTQASFSKLIPTHFYSPNAQVVLEGDPQHDNGVAGGEFLWCFDNNRYWQAPEMTDAHRFQAEEQMENEGYSQQQINRYLDGDASALQERPAQKQTIERFGE